MILNGTIWYLIVLYAGLVKVISLIVNLFCRDLDCDICVSCIMVFSVSLSSGLLTAAVTTQLPEARN